MKVYSDRTEGTNVQIDPAWQIWNGSVVFTPITGDGNDGGANCTECTKGSYATIGFGIMTNAGSSAGLNGYNFLVFSLKITNDFSQNLQVGLGDVGNQSWFNVTNYRDNQWHTYAIDLSSVTTLNTIGLVFGMRSTSGTWTTGSLRFDDVYYTKTTNHLSNVTVNMGYTNSVNTIFALYSETFPLNVTWDSDAKMDLWAGFTFTSDTSTSGDGSVSLKMVSSSGTWAGIGMRVEPITIYKDMSTFSNGSLVFSYKSAKANIKVGIEDGNGFQKWVFGETCVSSYGMAADDSWHTVTIPLSAYSGIDWTKIKQYYMFAQGTSYVIGDVYHIDNIYYTK